MIIAQRKFRGWLGDEKSMYVRARTPLAFGEWPRSMMYIGHIEVAIFVRELYRKILF